MYILKRFKKIKTCRKDEKQTRALYKINNDRQDSGRLDKKRSEIGIKFKRAEHLNVKRLIEKCQYLSTMYHAEAGGF